MYRKANKNHTSNLMDTKDIRIRNKVKCDKFSMF